MLVASPQHHSITDVTYVKLINLLCSVFFATGHTLEVLWNLSTSFHCAGAGRDRLVRRPKKHRQFT